MLTLRQALAKLNAAAEAQPAALDMPVVFTDGQCAHYEVSGYVFIEDTSEWPDEFCIAEALPPGVTTFVRIA